MQRILGHTGTGGERGRIINNQSYMTSLSATDYKDPPKTIKRIKAINPMPDGSYRTLKYQYFKTSIANFKSQGSFGATGVLRKIERHKILKETVLKGIMDNTDGTFESLNRVYSEHGVCPTINACSGGSHEPKVIKKCLTKR